MSDEYFTMFLILTSYLPQLLLAVFFPALLVGYMFNFMKNPAKNV